MPKGIDPIEYEKALNKLKQIEGRIRYWNNEKQFAEDALAVLEDEQGSERWQKHEDKRKRAVDNIARLTRQHEEIERKVKG